MALCYDLFVGPNLVDKKHAWFYRNYVDYSPFNICTPGFLISQLQNKKKLQKTKASGETMRRQTNKAYQSIILP